MTSSPRTRPAARASWLAKAWRSGPPGNPAPARTGAAGAWPRPRKSPWLRHCALPASSPGIRLHPARAATGSPEEPLMGELGAFLKIERVVPPERDPRERRNDFHEFVLPND